VIRRLTKFVRLPPTDQRLVAEAAAWLTVARLLLAAVPFRWIAPLLGHRYAPAASCSPVEGHHEAIRQIARALHQAAGGLPWNCTCLVKAIAGKAMLQCRGIESSLVLGVKKDVTRSMQAHAWLQAGALVLTGGDGLEGYTDIARFG
jgi:hypothetical protein